MEEAREREGLFEDINSILILSRLGIIQGSSIFSANITHPHSFSANISTSLLKPANGLPPNMPGGAKQTLNDVAPPLLQLPITLVTTRWAPLAFCALPSPALHTCPKLHLNPPHPPFPLLSAPSERLFHLWVSTSTSWPSSPQIRLESQCKILLALWHVSVATLIHLESLI